MCIYTLQVAPKLMKKTRCVPGWLLIAIAIVITTPTRQNSSFEEQEADATDAIARAVTLGLAGPPLGHGVRVRVTPLYLYSSLVF